MMFGKLMNYELRYLLRIFAPMWGIVLLLCTLSRLTLRLGEVETYLEGNMALAAMLLVLLTSLAIFTTVIVTFVAVLQRYYKGMFGDEGYLLFTLPVTTGQLIHAKGLSAILMVIVTVAVTIIGVMIASSYEAIWSQIGSMYEFVMYANDFRLAGVAVQSFWLIVLVVAGLAQGVYLVYLAISVGQMWKKHPVIGAVAAFYGIEMLVSGIGFVINGVIGGGPEQLIRNAVWGLEGGSTAQAIAVIIYMIVKCVLLVTVYFLVTKILLEKRLELQ